MWHSIDPPKLMINFNDGGDPEVVTLERVHSEFVDDAENKIVRPRQIYKGYTRRDFTPMTQRRELVQQELSYNIDSVDVRREASLKYGKHNRT